MRSIVDVLWFSGIASLLFIVVGTESLQYHISKYQPDREAIESFLGSLRFPLRQLYGLDSGYSFLPLGKSSNRLDHLLSLSRGRSNIARWVSAVIPAFVLSGLVVSLSRQSSSIQFIYHILSIVYILIIAYRSWRFGSGLKEYENQAASS